MTRSEKQARAAALQAAEDYLLGSSPEGELCDRFSCISGVELVSVGFGQVQFRLGTRLTTVSLTDSYNVKVF